MFFRSCSLSHSLFGLTASVAILVAAPASAQDIKIGAVLSVTGPASFLGDPQKKTLELLVDETNKKGGVNGRKLQLISYDDGGDANAARTFASRLVEEDKVAVMIGGSTTGASLAMSPVFDDAEIPFVSFAGAIQVVQPVKKFVFKTPHSDAMACERIFADIKARNFSRVALISGTDGFGRSMRDQCAAVAPKVGMKVVHEESFGPRDADMIPQLTNIRGNAEVQAIIVPGIGQGPAIVVRNYKQLEMKQPLYVSHGVASKEFIALAGAGAEGVRLPVPALLLGNQLAENDPQRAPVLAYIKLYEDRFRQPVSAFGAFAHDGFFMVMAAAERAKSFDSKKLRDEIEKTKNFVGVNGIYNMTPTDHMGLDVSGFRIVEIKNGDWTAVK